MGGGSGGAVAATKSLPVSAGVLNGKAVSLPKPVYKSTSGQAAAARTAGAVSVQVTIDESGSVIAAKAVGGNPLLRAAAVEAARKAKFSPTQLSGKPVKVVGAIVYNFGSADAPPTSSSVILGEEKVARLVEDEKRRELQMKLHSSLLALVDRLKERDAKFGAEEAGFVRDGKAEVQVWLTSKSSEDIARLKQLGFEVLLEPKTAGLIIGRVPVEKLAELAELGFVRYVTPQRSK
jgi:TonB family protein